MNFFILRIIAVLLICSFISQLRAQFSFDVDQSVKMSAVVEADPPRITINWIQDEGALGYELYRREYGEGNQWETPLATYAPEVVQYVDTDVEVGKYYEYKISKRTVSDSTGYGYVLSGIAMAPRHRSGHLLVITTETTVQEVGGEISEYRQVLSVDGWTSEVLAISAAFSAAEVKAALLEVYAERPFTAILLLGNVAIPHSGEINPDAHNDHRGAWSADVYYGDLDGTWTDTEVNNVTSENPRNHNVPGDGNWDQSFLPSDVEVAVGRVDFSEMPAFAEDEYELLRRYLAKDIAYRRGLLPFRRRGMVNNINSWIGALGQNGIRNFSPLVSPDSLYYNEWSTVFQNSYQWYYGGSAGNYTVGYLLGNSEYYANNGFQSIFTSWFGSYHGDYDYPDAFLRAILGSGTVLSTVWAGAPHWHYHEMGMGFPLATATKTTQNNDTLYTADYFPRSIHVSLLGDPTLTAYPFRGGDNLTLFEAPGSVQLNWTAAPEPVAGYYIYRRETEELDYTLIDSVEGEIVEFLDRCPTQGAEYHYLVRAYRLEETSSGSFYNLSAGTTARITVMDNYPPVSSFTTVQDGSSLNLMSTSVNADTLIWQLTDGTTMMGNEIDVELTEGENRIGLIAANQCSRDTSEQTFVLTSTQVFSTPSFSVYPTPASSFVFIKSPAAFTRYRIFASTGKIAQSDVFTATNQYQLNVSELPAGVYFIQLFSNHWGKFTHLTVLR